MGAQRTAATAHAAGRRRHEGLGPRKEGADETDCPEMGAAGLLHDADWEKYPDSHCRVIIEKLEAMNIDPEADPLHRLARTRYFGVEPDNIMDK